MESLTVDDLRRRAEMGAVNAWKSADGGSRLEIPTLVSCGAAEILTRLKNAGGEKDDLMALVKSVFECGQECGNINSSRLYANLLSSAPKAWPEHLMPTDPETLVGMEAILASSGHPGHVIKAGA